MYKTDEIFKILSGEKKSLKPEHVYKTAQQGLLRAMYFFRWCNKSGLEDTDKIAQKFAAGKIPEQQAEHFLSALVMIDHYDTDDIVKEALKEIDKKVAQERNAGVADSIEPVKIQRRILKNVYKNFDESIEDLKQRRVDLKRASAGVWTASVIILLVNIALAVVGTHQKFFNMVLPFLVKEASFWSDYGGFVSAGIFIIIPLLFIFLRNRHRLSEHSKKGEEYPEEILKMEETLADFRKKLEDMKINVMEAGNTQ